MGFEARARILVIDDHEENIKLVTRVLSKAGYETIASTTHSAEALALHVEFKPDLVLLDLHMGDKDGFEVLQEFASLNGGGERVPVLMITADDSPETKRRALALGAKDFVGKPFDGPEVLLRIANLLETRFLQLALEGQNSDLEQKVAERTKALEESQLEVLERLAAAQDTLDEES